MKSNHISLQPKPSAGRALGRRLRQGQGGTSGGRFGLGRAAPRTAFVLGAWLAGLATLCLALGALAQGSVSLSNAGSAGRVVDSAGHPYGGVFGLEVWGLDGTTIPANLLQPPHDTTGLYAQWSADGFWLEGTFANRNNASTPGIIDLGELDMPFPAVRPAGASMIVGLWMWNTDDPSFVAALAREPANLLAYGGVVFVNPTANYAAIPEPSPPDLSGWTSDLIMVRFVPEPSTLALAGLGATLCLLRWWSLKSCGLKGASGKPPGASLPRRGFRE
jgi:hypothetical protein